MVSKPHSYRSLNKKVGLVFSYPLSFRRPQQNLLYLTETVTVLSNHRQTVCKRPAGSGASAGSHVGGAEEGL